MVSQSGAAEFTIMGKTTDLTVVQKSIIDTIHKEGTPQKVIAKEFLYSSIQAGPEQQTTSEASYLG